MKLFIISLDMLVALPILSVAVLLLLSSVRGTQGYLLTLGSAQSARLGALTSSQRMALLVDGASNYSAASQITYSTAAKYGLSAQLVGVADAQACWNAGAVCRLVTVSGNAYVLVVSYEDAS